MRKRLLLLVPFLALSFLAVNKDSPLQSALVTTYDPIGPFEVGCPDYELTGTIKPLMNITPIKERMVVKTLDGTVIKSSYKREHQALKNVSYTLTFILPFESSLNDKGLSITIDFLNSVDEVIHSFSFKIRPVSPKNINPKSYINDYFINEDIVVDPDNYSKTKDEKIRFDSTLDYFNVDNYYLLSLIDTEITYECGLPFPGCVAHLHFVDYMKVFPYLDNDNVIPSFDIPLNTIKTKNGIRFSFPLNLYVNPQTLDMSLKALPGFMSTYNFYLPKNRCEELLDQTFTIVVSDFGHGKTSFSWDIKYTNNHRLIGGCSSSDYCVVGEPINE